MRHDINIVKKPWGHEYLIYQNKDVALWFLYISPNQCTSMHCHPKKTTGLVLLDGEVEISFLADSRKIKSVDKAMIRRGLFHSTKSISNEGSFILEIETPPDKQDLVRLNDKYGREFKPYEDCSFEQLKTNNCLWIEEPKSGEIKTYEFCNCLLKVEHINNIEIINSKNNKDLIVFLKGGLYRNIEGKAHGVTIPGDVGFAEIVKKVSTQLDGIFSETIIITITKNQNG
jgi:mannose-6-phosphate isomerase-like protein (cupin superfamily)